MFSRSKYILFCGAVVAFAGLIIWRSPFRRSPPGPSVLIVSACSVRWDRIGVNQPDRISLTPKIDSWARNAFVLSNAIAEKPWQNYTYDGDEAISKKFLHKHGYLKEHQRPRRYTVPPSSEGENGEWYWPETAILSYKDDLERLRRVFGENNDPGYTTVHLRYMHYPYYDSVNMGPEDWKKLSPLSRKLIEKYRSAPDRYQAQLPLIELLFNSFDLLKKKFGVSTQVLSASGVISDPRRMPAWTKTPDFKADVQLAKELYDLKMAKFDEQASEVLNLFGNEEALKRTIVIFTGDHGEALMEHGVIGHSINAYDEMLRYPLIVKFPPQFPGAPSSLQRLEGQVTHRIMSKLVREMLTGEVSAANFAAKVSERSEEAVASRNCSDSIRALRVRSEWKLIKNLASGKNELYNLKSDPHELKNLIEEQPELAWQLEDLLLEKNADIKKVTRRELKAEVCASN